MIQFGMRCHDLCPKMEMEKLFEEIHENHIDQVQLAFKKSISNYDFTTGHYSAGFGRYIAKQLEKNEIHVAVLGCYINPTNPVESKREAEVARFIEHLKYARAMGADMVGTETGRFHPDFQVVRDTRTEAAYQLLLKSFREIVDAAEKLGVIVGVEGVFDHTLYSPAMMKRFLEDIDSPNVEVILDPVNLIHPEEVDNQEDVIAQAFACYGDKISMMHMKDFVFEGQSQKYRHVGEGLFHYDPLMKLVKEHKPYITMLMENSSKERSQQDIQFLKDVYDRV